MKKFLFYLFFLSVIISACDKKNNEGIITYNLTYQLPDSLKRYAEFLPKEATVYFKGDTAVSVQTSGTESTTVICSKPGNYMRVLLKSATKNFVVDYNKTDQAEEASLLPKYTYLKTSATKIIAGYTATKYKLLDKTTGDSTEAWFTKSVSVIPNSISMLFDQSLGVPLLFTTNQNGMISTTTIKSIKFDTVPDSIFRTPAGYQVITPKQLKELPVDN